MIPGLKLAIWAMVLGLAFLRPAFGERAWRRFERAAARVARRRWASIIGMAGAVLLLRLALLPLWPIPKPVIYDEFGYLLQADTFASGRLTNPTHKLWPFFESLYILHQPTYTSQYPPGQGLVMALGQYVAGHAWFGVWLSAGVLMAALLWAFYGWLPPAWALLGGAIAFPLCFSSYWMNSYWGGAAAAIGGALLLGAYPRIARQGKFAYGWLFGLGLAILALTRQYEGLLFALPLALALAARTRSPRLWAPVAAVTAAALGFLMLYNLRVTGDALRLPYMEYDRQYAYVRHFNFLPLAPDRSYRQAGIFDLHHEWMFEKRQRARSWHLLPDRAGDWGEALGILLVSPMMWLAPLLLLPRLARDRRMRLPLICVGVLVLGSLVEIAYYTHYAAPAAAAFVLLTVQALRHLRQVNLALARALPLAVLLLWAGPSAWRIATHDTPDQVQPVNSLRGKLEAWLAENSLKRSAIIVRYTGHQMPHEEWVYNGANIDAQDVVWAHDMGPEENRKLVDYYKDRAIWLLEPDRDPRKLEPYGE